MRQVLREKDSASAGLGGGDDQRVRPRKRVTLLRGPCALDDAEIDGNRPPCGEVTHDPPRFFVIEAGLRLASQRSHTVPAEPESSPVPSAFATGACIRLRSQPALQGPKDRNSGRGRWYQRRPIRSCKSARVGLWPPTHSIFRGLRASERSMATSYSSSWRLAASIMSESQLETLRFARTARTRSHIAVSSGSVTVTFFMSREQDDTNLVSLGESMTPLESGSKAAASAGP